MQFKIPWKTVTALIVAIALISVAIWKAKQPEPANGAQQQTQTPAVTAVQPATTTQPTITPSVVTEPSAAAVYTQAQLDEAIAKASAAAAQQAVAQYQQQSQQQAGAAANGTQAAATPAQSGGTTQASNANKDASVKAENSGTVVNVEQNPTFIINSPGSEVANSATKAQKTESTGADLGALAVAGFIGWVWGNIAAGTASQPAPPPPAKTYTPAPTQPAPDTGNQYACSDAAFRGAPPVVAYHVTSVDGSVGITLDSHQQSFAKLCMVFMDSEYRNQGWQDNRFAVGSGNGVSYSFSRQGWKFNIAGFLKDGTPVWGRVPCYGRNTTTKVAPGLQIVCNADGEATYALTH